MKKFALTTLIIVAMISASLSFAQETQDQATLDKVDQYRKAAKELLEKQGNMGWDSWVEGAPSNQALLYKQYEYLFTKDAIEQTEKALNLVSDPTQKRALEYFLLYQDTEYIGDQTALLYDIYMDMEANLTCYAKPLEQFVPYRDLEYYLSTEADRQKRADLAKCEYWAYNLFNESILKRDLDMTMRLSKELGYPSYTDLSIAYKMFDVEELKKAAEYILESTEIIYYDLFDEVSPIPRSETHRSDILYLLGARNFDEYFPKEKVVPAAKKFLNSLGIDLNKQKNIKLDARDLDKKVPRAVCFSITVPTDIRVSVKPIGGKDDYSSLFHELGHAEHYAHTTSDVWEFQQLGPNAVTETYAYLFEYIIEDPLWVKENLSMPPDVRKSYLKHSLFSKIYMMRRYAAKFLYELELGRNPEMGQKLYQEYMSRAYGFQLTDEESLRYLSDVDPFLYSADYLQAFLLEAMLIERLEEQFGKRATGKEWWKNNKASEFLKNLWSDGNFLSGRELAIIKLGYDGLDPKPLERRIEYMMTVIGSNK